MVVTIVVLIILATISIQAVFGENGIIKRAEEGKKVHEQAAQDEEKQISQVEDKINAVSNRKSVIKDLKCTERTADSMNIIARATDEDEHTLTYTLYVGTSKDNITKCEEVKENIKQGEEVQWQITTTDASSTYYIKLVVQDKYSQTESAIKQISTMPQLGTLTVDNKTTTSFKVKVSATDEDETTKLTYILYLGTEANNLSPIETIAEQKEGDTAEFSVDNLDQATKYYYKVGVEKGLNLLNTAVQHTYTNCSGTTLDCNGKGTNKCSLCSGTGYCPHSNLSRTDKAESASTRCGINGCRNFSQYLVTSTCNLCGRSSGIWRPCSSDRSAARSKAVPSQTTCPTCKGTKYAPCTHGYTGSHKYCSHDMCEEHEVIEE